MNLLHILLALPLSAGQTPDYDQALVPRDWQFPRDHGQHGGFKT